MEGLRLLLISMDKESRVVVIAWFRGLIFLPYRNFFENADLGKLYVTNSVFSSDIGRLCVIILHLFFPSVKPLPTITESIELRFFLENPFAESPPSLCNNPSVL